MNEKRLICYVASPVRSVLELHDFRPEGYKRARELAILGASEVKNKGFIPLSPVLLFLHVYFEGSERAKALEDGLALLSRCHCFYEVKSTYESEGIKKEKEVALSLGIQLLN